MPSFQTHMSFGTFSGLVAARFLAGYSFSISRELIIPAGLILVLGSILPDLDSDEGKPLKLTLEVFSWLSVGIYFLAWFSTPDKELSQLIIGVLAVYILAKYMIGELVKRLTHHRGMFHSVPALGITMLLAVLIFNRLGLSDYDTVVLSLAMGLGFLSHLILDQLANWTGKRNLFWGQSHVHPRAIKFLSESRLANAAAYLLLSFLFYFTYPDLIKYWENMPRYLSGG